MKISRFISELGRGGLRLLASSPSYSPRIPLADVDPAHLPSVQARGFDFLVTEAESVDGYQQVSGGRG